MITGFNRTVLASIKVLALSAVALTTPALSANETSRHGHSAGRSHEAAARTSAPFRHARYPSGAGTAEGPGFYQGYGHNSNNWCFPGESMYDGC